MTYFFGIFPHFPFFLFWRRPLGMDGCVSIQYLSVWTDDWYCSVFRVHKKLIIRKLLENKYEGIADTRPFQSNWNYKEGGEGRAKEDKI